jgi:hypothetical protein
MTVLPLLRVESFCEKHYYLFPVVPLLDMFVFPDGFAIYANTP